LALRELEEMLERRDFVCRVGFFDAEGAYIGLGALEVVTWL